MQQLKAEHPSEGIRNKKITTPGTKYYKNPLVYAMDRFAFYQCHKCNEPYYGGMRKCEAAGMNEDGKVAKEKLTCGSCAMGPNAKKCQVHGTTYIGYKCKFCCRIASFFCWGNTHFCAKCHKIQEGGKYLNRLPISALPKCPGPSRCPLRLKHPPNGTDNFAIGCTVCRSNQIQ